MKNKKLLLDTHVWVWFLQGTNIKPSVVKEIEAALAESSVNIAAISLWELAVLLKKERITVNEPIHAWLKKAVSELQLKTLPLSAEVALESTSLPGEFHGDPADRMIVASARVHDCTLLTKDKAIIKYAKEKHVKVMACC